MAEPKDLRSHKPGMVVEAHYIKTHGTGVERSGNSKAGVKATISECMLSLRFTLTLS